MPSKITATKSANKKADDAVAFLASKDEKLAELMAAVGPFRVEISQIQSSYEALAQSIVYQQLNGKAAASIFNRLKTLTHETNFPTPEEILELSEETIRSVGLSRAKTLALIDLAAKTKAGLVPTAEAMNSMTDSEIIDALTSIRGIGPWSVEMILMFRLGRLDIMPSTDFGVRKGFAITYGTGKKQKTTTKDGLPSPKEVLAYSELWRPYRSIASWYMWRAVERYQAQIKLENKTTKIVALRSKK